MEKSIDDIEFRKLVLKMYDEGYSKDEIMKKLEIKKHCFDDIITTFYNNELDVNIKLNNSSFTKEEDEFILSNINKSSKVLAKELNRAYYRTRHRVEYLKKINGLKKAKKEKVKKDKNYNEGKPFEKEEILFIKERYEAGDKVEDIANVLGRSKISIQNACTYRQIKRIKGHNIDEDARIVKEYIEKGLKNKEIMEKMDISEGKLANIIRKNNLQRKHAIEKRCIPEDLDIPSGYKYCLICKEIKPLNNFNSLARNKDGKRPWCRECEKKRNKELREKKKNGK